LSFAGVHDLPMIFVSHPKPVNTKLQAQAYAFPTIAVDGNDVVAVYRVACEAIAHARKGNGPTLIECQTLPSNGDPILNMEQYLRRKGLFREELKKDVTVKFGKALDAAIERQQATAGGQAPRRKLPRT
jgi:TPP-dependent pyruvate/acetoin dehydrogenase alpha subunit